MFGIFEALPIRIKHAHTSSSSGSFQLTFFMSDLERRSPPGELNSVMANSLPSSKEGAQNALRGLGEHLSWLDLDRHAASTQVFKGLFRLFGIHNNTFDVEFICQFRSTRPLPLRSQCRLTCARGTERP